MNGRRGSTETIQKLEFNLAWTILARKGRVVKWVKWGGVGEGGGVRCQLSHLPAVGKKIVFRRVGRLGERGGAWDTCVSWTKTTAKGGGGDYRMAEGDQERGRGGMGGRVGDLACWAGERDVRDRKGAWEGRTAGGNSSKNFFAAAGGKRGMLLWTRKTTKTRRGRPALTYAGKNKCFSDQSLLVSREGFRGWRKGSPVSSYDPSNFLYSVKTSEGGKTM